jgi:hypothetical protein
MRELLRRQRLREEANCIVKRERGIKHERSLERSSISSELGADNDDYDVSFVSSKRRGHVITLNDNGQEMIDLT